LTDRLVVPAPSNGEESPALAPASWSQDLQRGPRVSALVFPHVDEAVLCAAEVAGVMKAEAVEHAATVPAMIRRLDAPVVRLPVAHPALQCHVPAPERFLGFNRSPERRVKVFSRAVAGAEFEDSRVQERTSQ
jgi:hypothetical protein